MKKQEAIEELKEAIEYNNTCWFDDYMPLSEEATELAIKALEQPTVDDTGVHSHCVIDKLHRLAEEAENAEVRKGIIRAIEVINDTKNSDGSSCSDRSDRFDSADKE